MKKTSRKLLLILAPIALILIVTAVILFHPNDYCGASVGMSTEDLRSTLAERDYFEYAPYIFYTNRYGDYVTVRLSDDHSVVSELTCSKKLAANPSPANFARIEVGMELSEVVRIVGIPFASFTSGLDSVAFRCSSGEVYVVYLSRQKMDSGSVLVVQSPAQVMDSGQ